MRRLAVLLIVFVLASTADATISLYIDGSPAPPDVWPMGEPLTIQVYSDEGGATANWGGYLVLDWGSDGSLSNPQTLPAAGNMGSMTPYSYPGWGIGYTLTTADSMGDVQAGIQHTADLVGLLYIGDSATVSLYDGRVSTTVPVDTLWINVPEPMTMSLLALGGALVLIRKRRS